tara:strand:- start:135 stop:548 length:414 start_codon:yes stop_codon:yes gene_type:complete
MKLSRKQIRKIIVEAMNINPMTGLPRTEADVVPEPSRQDFVMAASGIGNVLHGAGFNPRDYNDYAAPMFAVVSYFENLLRGNENAAMPGKHGRKTSHLSPRVLMTLQELGLDARSGEFQLRALAQEVVNDVENRLDN